MPDPITADELEAALKECAEVDKSTYWVSLLLTVSDWNSLIACLREHEERAAARWEMDINGGMYFQGQNYLGDIKSQLGGWNWFSAKGAAGWCESIAAAQAAVEKAVKP